MPKLPASVGKYKVIDRLGRGGMGLVYKAEHPTLGISVVLKKLMLKGDNAHRERFRREATLMMNLRHENVVGVYDHFKVDSAYYLVMEYVDARPLSELLAREGPIPQDETSWLIGRVALALAHIHEHGIVHRDLKPSNILLARDGSVKLGDFGIAFSPGESHVITAEGTTLGTPSFMAPEQLVDARQADERSDIWSLGVCLFEMLTAQKFVTGPTPAAINEAIPEALKNIRKRLPEGLPRSLRRFLKKSLHRHPKNRMSDGTVAVRMIMANRYQKVPLSLQSRIAVLFSAVDPSAYPVSESPESAVKTPAFHRSLSIRKLVGKFFATKNIRPILAIPVFISVVFLLSILLIPGLWDELIRPNRVGRLQLVLVFPEQTPSYWLGGVNVRIYRRDGGNLIEIAEPVLRDSQDGLRLMSRYLSFPVGAYRMSWSLGDRIVWRSFYLGSIRENRTRDRHPFIMEETLGVPPVFPLELNVRVYNAVTEEALPARVSWERLDKPGGGLESGGRYKLTMEAEGYGTETLTIATSPWRREVSVQTALWPLPGSVHIRNLSSRWIMPHLNGQRFFMDIAGVPAQRRIHRIPPEGDFLLTLIPQRYIVTPGRGKKGMLEFAVHAGSEVELVIEEGGENEPYMRLMEN